jgi:hypothetical protein
MKDAKKVNYIRLGTRNAAVLCTCVDTRHAIEDFTYAEDYLDKWVKGQVKTIQQFSKSSLSRWLV